MTVTWIADAAEDAEILRKTDHHRRIQRLLAETWVQDATLRYNNDAPCKVVGYERCDR